MNTMHTAILIIHTFIAVIITVLVLLQRGKGADAGAGFGAGASGTVFGARGSTNFFSRATAVLATAFFVSSLTLAYISSQQTDAPASVIEGAPVIEPDEVQTESPDDLLPEFPELDDDSSPAGPQDLPALDADSDTAEPDEPQ